MCLNIKSFAFRKTFLLSVSFMGTEMKVIYLYTPLNRRKNNHH